MSEEFDVAGMFTGLTEDEAKRILESSTEHMKAERARVLAERVTESQTQLQEQYQREAARLDEQKTHLDSGARARKLHELKRRYRQLGLNIW